LSSKSTQCLLSRTLIEQVEQLFLRAKSLNHRLLFYVAHTALGKGFVSSLLEKFCSQMCIAVVYRDVTDESTSLLLDEVKKSKVNFRELQFKDVNTLLGTTWDSLIADLTNHMSPNDIGVVVELVKGGGLVLLVGPSPEELESWKSLYHSFFVAPPFDIGQVSKRFEKRLLKKTIGRTGVVYVDANLNMAIGPAWPEPQKLEQQKVEGKIFPREIYEMCKTNDQRKTLFALENLLNKNVSMVIKADRGRGKSAVLGLALAALLKSAPWQKYLVTAPERSSVQTLFEFLQKALEALGVNFRVTKSEDSVVSLELENSVVYYRSPFVALRERADLIVVDEAAGVSLPILIGIMKRFERAVYSTTMHGYEGAGRGFSVLFLNRLKKQRTNVLEIEMKEPVRYASNDPVESWLYDVLVLDAEQPSLTRLEIKPIETLYSALNRDELFEKDELLRDLIGLYITTHYRNKPDDLAILGNSPNHEVRTLFSQEGKVIAAAHVCTEGDLSDSQLKLLEKKDLKGQLIPSMILRYYPHLKALGKLKGLRIVRIAVHAQLHNRGFGSHLLSKIEEEFKRFDWLGSSFGANHRLLSFWFKNGYYPILIGARRNPVSGEFSTVVLKPISIASQKLCVELSKEFRLRFLESLYDSYFDMDSELAWMLLSKTYGEVDVKPEFKGSQRLRLESFLKDLVIYEGASDAIRALVKAHFIASEQKRVKIEKDYERLLILKSLQGRSWEAVHRILGLTLGVKTINDLRSLYKSLIQKMCEAYLK